ncbi:MAG: hypothetical protein H0W30_18905 [Gemmatimonadaceae bacterium]|nr:hypothetical protein [Gemmatimonadaceae bacterium]MBA3560655.1 hypothetical protein [Gemmatimonadaceae bacterium]
MINNEQMLEEGRAAMVDFLLKNGVDPAYAKVFVMQQLTVAQSYQGKPILPYAGKQFSPLHYDELGKLLLVRSGRGRSLPENGAEAEADTRDEIRSRVAGVF